jgi:hypothetical protein
MTANRRTNLKRSFIVASYSGHCMKKETYFILFRLTLVVVSAILPPSVELHHYIALLYNVHSIP